MSSTNTFAHENLFATDKYGILEGHTRAELEEADEEEKKLVSMLTTRFDEAKSHRATWDKTWWLNREYLAGHQFIVRNRTTNEVFRLPQEEAHRLLAMDNILRPTQRTLLGKLVRAISGWRVRPSSDDLADMHAAEIATALLRHQFVLQRTDRLYIEAYQDVSAEYGIAVWWLSWDQQGGGHLAHCEECGYQSYDEVEAVKASLETDEPDDPVECPQCRAEIEQEIGPAMQAAEQEAAAVAELGLDAQVERPEMPDIPQLTLTREGEVKLEVLDPFEFYFDPGAVKLEACNWICRVSNMHVSEARKQFEYTGKAHLIAEENGLLIEEGINILSTAGGERNNARTLTNYVRVYEFHEKPTEEHPHGRIIWMVNNRIMDEIDHPYYDIFNRLPAFMWFWQKNRQELLGETWVEQAWPTQKELNLLLTQMREHRELSNRPKLLAAVGSGISVEEIDTSAGQIIFYNPLYGKPDWMEPPSMATYVTNEVERMQSSIRGKGSVTPHEAGSSNGEVSGRFAAILDAQADQQVGPVLKYNKGEYVEMGRCILALCQKFYSSKRRWTINGSERPMTYQFDEMDLRPGADVEVEEEDSLSTNTAVRFGQVMEMWSAPNPLLVDARTGAPDVKAFAKLARIKLPGVGPEVTSVDRAFAAAIPYRLKNGETYTPQPWDDSDVFAEELSAWCKTQGRMPGNEQLVTEVWELAQVYVQQSRAALMQQQMMAGIEQGGAAPVSAGLPVGAGTGALPSAAATDSPAVAEAEGTVQQADAAGEAAAIGGAPHES